MVKIFLRVLGEDHYAEHMVSRVPGLNELVARDDGSYLVKTVCHHVDPVEGEVVATVLIERPQRT